MKKAIVSACLLGHMCRYDGKVKKTTEVIDALKDYEIIPFCPEAPLFGTPRERISVVNIDRKNKIITDKTNKDVTKLLEDEINSFVKLYPDAQKIVLKSKSPSCGFKTTPILNEKRETIGIGNGIAADILSAKFPNLKISDEREFA
nr:DUF523 domain-containing protein [uncultured Sulfurimonas sp.]